MKSTKIILFVVCIVVIGVLIGVASKNKNSEVVTLSETASQDAMEKMVSDDMTAGESAGEMMMKKDETAMEGHAMMSAHGTYEVYTPEKVAAATGDTVLFFYAPWCPTCRGADADITKNASALPAGLTILKTDYDTYTELKKKYGVTYQHTFVQVDAAGNMIKKWSGGDYSDILANVE